MSAGDARILVADDEDSLRWVLEKGLRQAGYNVTSVKDGDSALRAFASYLRTTDIEMVSLCDLMESE